ncbi:MAG: Gfo/Idh/MocA family protein [Egibacteraceae bacterium]
MTLRAGVLGLGMMGQHHARVLRQLDGVKLVGVADPAGDRFGCARGVPCAADLDALLELGLDICVVAVPTGDHEAAGVRLAEEGIHTLIEKPLAGDVPAARRLVRAFDQAGLVGCVGHIERYNPALRSLRARLEAGDLGAIFQIATRRQGPFPSRVRDVGVVKDLATHDLDLTAWAAGSPFVSLSARTVRRAGSRHEDLVAVTGLLADRTVTNHLVNWLTPVRERIVTVTGERGCLVADALTANLAFHGNSPAPLFSVCDLPEDDMTVCALPKPDPLWAELAAFRDAVAHGTGDVVGMANGLAALEVAEACLTSARKGVTVDLCLIS